MPWIPIGKRTATTCGMWVCATLLLALPTGCGKETAPICDGERARSRLDEAAAGESVVLGACAVQGPLRVPEGVSLHGQGAGSTTVRTSEGTAVELHGGQTASGLHALTVESSGHSAVVASGGGTVHIEQVTLESTAGIGLVGLGVDDLVVSQVQVQGPVTRDNAQSDALTRTAPWVPDDLQPADSGTCGSAEPTCETGATRPAECPGCEGVTQYCDECGRWTTVTATRGVLIRNVSEAMLTEVSVRGMAEFGATIADSGSVTWSGGTVSGNLGVGVFATRVQLRFEGVQIEQTRQGFRAQPAYAGYFAGEEPGQTQVESMDTAVSDNGVYGMVHVGAKAHHTDLVAESNGDAALWVGESTEFQLDGSESTLRNNGFGGVVVVDSRNVSLEDAAIDQTAERTSVIGTEDSLRGQVQVGDGVQLVGTVTEVRLTDLTLTGNERVGLLADLGSNPQQAGISFANVQVAIGGSGTAGALAGSVNSSEPGTLQPGGPEGWDDGIERDDATAAVDQDFAQTLDIAPAAMPSTPLNPADVAGIVMPSN